jgi:tetratricopeptide (TPR) repeat protein
MLIGPDFFLSHRIYVANTRQKLYFTYNGGPVFNLTHLKPGAAPGAPDSPAAQAPPGAGPAPPAAQASQAAPGAPAALAAAPAGDATPAPPAPTADAAAASAAAQDRPPGETQATVADKGDASDFSRRGGAMASRGDYDHALTALSRACELAPDNPEYFFQRSRLYLRMGNQVLAGKDLDQTLKLNPRHVAALVSRAELLLESGDVTGATADLDAANRAATKQEDLRYAMAKAYGSADRLSSAVEQFDLWIAAHGEDERIPYAQAGRCRARALAGSDLPLALKDCNAALKRAGKGTPHYARVADSRGLVFLRLGDYARSIADYDAAIAIAPQSAWGWYGRGIDKLRQHQTAAGEADIAQAKSLRSPGAGSSPEYGFDAFWRQGNPIWSNSANHV